MTNRCTAAGGRKKGRSGAFCAGAAPGVAGAPFGSRPKGFCAAAGPAAAIAVAPAKAGNSRTHKRMQRRSLRSGIIASYPPIRAFPGSAGKRFSCRTGGNQPTGQSKLSIRGTTEPK